MSPTVGFQISSRQDFLLGKRINRFLLVEIMLFRFHIFVLKRFVSPLFILKFFGDRFFQNFSAGTNALPMQRVLS